MSATEVQQGPIEISWDNNGNVVVLDKNRHRFLLTMQQAADACARGKEQIVWRDEFENMLKRVKGWLKDHDAQISAAYAGCFPGEIVIFIIPKGERMDFELSDEIAQLEVELFQDFANCRCEVRQIPGHTTDALATFLDLDRSLLLHGKPLSASETVGA